MRSTPLTLCIATLAAGAAAWAAVAPTTQKAPTTRAAPAAFPKAPAGFTVDTFAAAPQFNCPAGLAVAPDGSVAFIGEDPDNVRSKVSGTGRILRFLDKDGDGKADGMTVLADKINGVRGLAYMDGKLYCVSAPTFTVYDDNATGLAAPPRVLITDFSQAPESLTPDHSVGQPHFAIDGWIYISVGDQGLVKAKGVDGNTIRMHQGGIVRIRPDGTELEVYCTGTRNAFGHVVTPLLDVLTRDNTNDGDGWDVEFEHDVQYVNFGYPMLYKSFADEGAPLLANYGGGSGTGSIWVEEPGWPAKYNNQPYTGDWGRGWVYRHELARSGASYKAPAPQAEFFKGQRPLVVTLDGVGHMWVSDWGHNDYGRPKLDSGVIYRITPPEHQPMTWPDLTRATAAQLLDDLQSASDTLRIHSQHEIIKRGPNDATLKALVEIITASESKTNTPLENRVAALFTYKQLLGAKANDAIRGWMQDAALRQYAIKALVDRKTQLDHVTPGLFLDSLIDKDARVRAQAIIALIRLGDPAAADAIVPALTDGDPMISHLALRAMRLLSAVDTTLAAYDDAPTAAQADAALRVLREMHSPAAVDGLIKRYTDAKADDRKAKILDTLGRLYFREDDNWDGSWWGIHPDTRGPYFKPVEWGESKKIAGVLTAALKSGDDAARKAVFALMNRYRVPLPVAKPTFVELAKTAGPLQADAAKALARIPGLGGESLDAITAVALSPQVDTPTRAELLAQIPTTGAGAEVVGDLLARLDAAKNTSPDILAAGAKALAKYRNIDAATEIKKLTVGGSFELRTQLYAAMFEVKEAVDEEFVAIVPKAWKDPAQADALVEAVGRTRAREQLPGLRKMLDDSRANVRQAAITVISKLRDDGATTALLDLAEGGRDRIDALRALSRIAPDKLSATDLTKATDRLVALAESEKSSNDAGALAETVRVAKEFAQDERHGAATTAAYLARLPKPPAVAPADMLIADLTYDDVQKRIDSTKGDPARGKELFTSLGCVNCHTTDPGEKPKGPYLGDIGVKANRHQIADSVMRPNAQIVMGYETYWFKTDEGDTIEGFVPRESGDDVDVRKTDGTMVTLKKANIEARGKRGYSAMPEGLVARTPIKDFSSLLSYLETLKSAKVDAK